MKEKILQFETRKDLFWVGIALIGLLSCSYIYCVTTTIRNIVAEKNLSMQISDINRQLSTKEFSFINLENTITLSYAQSLGFSNPEQKVFITPKSVSYVSNTTNQL